MRTILFFLFVGGMSLAWGQSCCSSPEATAEFAALGKQSSFQNAHELPIPFEKESLMGENINFPTADGGEASAYYIAAENEASNQYVFVFHEWWGLNDYVRREAEVWHKELGDVHVIALDLYDGKVAETREKASEYMNAAERERILSMIAGAKEFAGQDAEIATIGWCFGGGWSLQASLELGEQAVACVMYYGMPEKDVARLKQLNPDVLGIFAAKDKWINDEVVEAFVDNMGEAGKNLDVHVFDADHAFANPSSARYTEDAAVKAHAVAREFLEARLR